MYFSDKYFNRLTFNEHNIISISLKPFPIELEKAELPIELEKAEFPIEIENLKKRNYQNVIFNFCNFTINFSNFEF